jgi:hypothetical protein
VGPETCTVQQRSLAGLQHPVDVHTGRGARITRTPVPPAPQRKPALWPRWKHLNYRSKHLRGKCSIPTAVRFFPFFLSTATVSGLQSAATHQGRCNPRQVISDMTWFCLSLPYAQLLLRYLTGKLAAHGGLNFQLCSRPYPPLAPNPNNLVIKPAPI